MNRFKAWMLKATPAQQQELADAAANGSRQYLYHISNERRTASPDHGVAIERVTLKLHKESKGQLPIVYRTDVVPSCKKCEFAEACLGTKIVSRT